MITTEELGELAVLFIEDAWQWEAFIAWAERSRLHTRRDR